MPLPENGQAWPPALLQPISKTLSEWSAWYEGTPEALGSVYSTQQRDATAPDRAGGLRGFMHRMWWGRQPSGSAERADQSHIPIAADLARVSADLLYADAPELSTEHKENQTRLDLYLPDIHAGLAAGAELGAVLGGRYHRVTWDRQLLNHSFLSTVDADAAFPEFRWGRLVAATFWYVLSDDKASQTVWRHLERHELDDNGDGLILHGLYEGTRANLGMARPLTEHPTTEPLAEAIDAQGALVEGRTPGLAIAYIPNQTPQRRWRQHPIGRHLGRSDFDGVEPLMDNLDEAFSSWMRDLRIGKGRIIVPAYMLRDNGPGMGAAFDMDRSVYDTLNIPDAEGKVPPIIPQQFAIRYEEHQATCQEIVRQIVQTAGYSAQTFGESSDASGAMTATEVKARERRTFRTRDRKVRNETPAITALLTKMLTIDTAVFGAKGLDPSEPITVTFADNIEDSPLTLAQTSLALFQAKAASTNTLVAMMHPEWTDEQVTTETDLIFTEQQTVTDPFSLG